MAGPPTLQGRLIDDRIQHVGIIAKPQGYQEIISGGFIVLSHNMTTIWAQGFA